MRFCSSVGAPASAGGPGPACRRQASVQRKNAPHIRMGFSPGIFPPRAKTQTRTNTSRSNEAPLSSTNTNPHQTIVRRALAIALDFYPKVSRRIAGCIASACLQPQSRASAPDSSIAPPRFLDALGNPYSEYPAHCRLDGDIECAALLRQCPS